MASLYFKVAADYDNVIRLRTEIEKLKSTLSGMDGNTPPAALHAMEVQLAKNTNELDAMVSAAAKAGNEMEHNFKKKIFDASQAVNTFSDKIIDQKAVIRDIETDVRNLAATYSKLNKFDPSRGNMLAELNASRSALAEEKAVLFGLQQEQSKARLSVKRLRDEYALYNNEGRSVSVTNEGMSISFGKVLGVIGGVGVLKELASEITTVTGQFQRFENVLTNALGGDNNKAKQYLGDIADFAAKTNFQLDELTDNFLKFVNRGVTPSMEAMSKLGDFTNSVSKPYAQLSEAILDINNPERWKEFGVQVQANGSKVNLTFRGMKIEADKTVESVMNAIERFGSMDGIKGSTEAIAGTIEGQMSNLQDTITSVLNEIGQANSKVISGSISMASELIQNYDKVGRVIVGLIATYGTYRTAVMLATAAENGHSIAMLLTRDRILLVRRAQQLLNATMLANPYVAVTTLVAGLAAAMWALSGSTTEADKAQKRYNDSKDGYEKAILSEQRELAKLKGELSATTKGTDEYNTIRDKIVANYGKYDKNLKDEIDRVGLLDATYQNLTKSIEQSFGARQYERFKQEQGTALDDVMSKNLGKIQDRLVDELGDEEGSNVYTKIRLAILERKELDEDIKSTLDKIQDKGTILADSRVDSYIRNIRKAQEATDSFDAKARVKFGIEGGKDNNGGSAKDGDKTVLSSISDEIKTATEKISTLKKELADLRSGKTQAEAGKTVKDTIEEKTKELKATEDALSVLTGRDKSSDKKTDDDQKKQLEKQKELSRSILDSELKLQASRVAAMEDGKTKRLALAEQEYRETIATIQEEKEEYQKKVKETKGKEDPVVIASFGYRETVAKDKKNTDVAKVEKEYVEEYKRRTKALTDIFLNEEQRKLSAIKARYAEERKWADEQLKTGGMTKDEHKTYTVNIDKSQQQETYRSMLDNLNDYKQQEKDLRDKWDTDIATAAEAKDAYLVAKLMEGKQKALSSLNGQMLQETDEWQQLFGNLDNLTVEQLNKLINTIKNKAKNLDLKPVDMKAVTDNLKEVDDLIRTKNPFASLSKHLKEYKEAEDETTEKNALKEMFRDTASSIDMVKGGFDAVVGGLTDMGLAGDEATQQLLGDISNLMGAASQLATGIASANPIGIIQGGIGVLTSVFNIFNNDKRHEKKIKELQENVDDLSKAYDRLGEAIENAYSTDKASLIDQESEILRQQNELIQQQIKEEEDKKKTDNEKIKEWQDTVEENNRRIEENTKKRRVEAIMGTDIKSAIDEFAQAYADAWAKGEKAAGKSADIVKGLIRTSIIEMLKKDLKPEVEAFMTFLSEAMADGIIDAAEQQRIDAWEKKLEGIADKSLAGKDEWLKDDESDQLGITSDSLSDTILDGLRSGKSGIKDFAGSFEDMMKTAVLNSLKTKYLEGPLKEFQKKFAELSESGGQLTEAEIEELRGMYSDIINDTKTQFDIVKDISGLDFDSERTASSKGIGSISQESANVIDGKMSTQLIFLDRTLVQVTGIAEQMRFIYDLQSRGWKNVEAIKELSVKVAENTSKVAEISGRIEVISDRIADNTKSTASGINTINNKGVLMRKR